MQFLTDAYSSNLPTYTSFKRAKALHYTDHTDCIATPECDNHWDMFFSLEYTILNFYLLKTCCYVVECDW